MKRHTCKRCGKKRWAKTVPDAPQAFRRDICKRCFEKEHGSPDWREPRPKRIKHKRSTGPKPTGKKERTGKKGRRERDA